MTTLDKQFTATLEQSPAKGRWTYVVMDGSPDYFGTRGLVKIRLPRVVGDTVMTTPAR